MGSNQTLFLVIFSFAALLGGEYHVLISFDPLIALQTQDRFALLLLKIAMKMGVPSRVGFVLIYSLWLLTCSSFRVKSRGKKVSLLVLILLGCLFFAGSFLLINMQSFSKRWLSMLYPFSVFLVSLSGLLLASLINVKRRERFGVRNDKKKISSPYSFNFNTQDGWINIVNPFRGIFISGGAGSGKTYSLAYPIIDQAVSKGYCGIVYDFKFPTLAERVNEALIVHSRKELKGNNKAKEHKGKHTPVKHYIVNFLDPARSHRLNPLKPENLPKASYAEEYALAIINNLLPESIRKKDFWIRSACAILTSVIWFLKKHHSLQCTLPHVVNLILYKDYLHLLSMLETDLECADMIRSLLSAIENEAGEQIAGVVATLQIAIVRINTPEVCWVLSGDDLDLNLNDPLDPKLLTLGSYPTLVDTFSPLISLIATVALKLMNSPNKRHSLLLLDEAPTIYIPKLDIVPATARSNKVATIYMAQDFSQMVASYGKEVAEVVMANLNNQLYGRASSLATAKHVSELFGREEKRMESTSRGQSQHEKGQSLNESLSTSLQEKLVVRPQDLVNLQVGEFIGMSVESDEPYFWSKIKVKQGLEGDFSIPSFARGIELERNFVKIKREAEWIIHLYEKRKMAINKNKMGV